MKKKKREENKPKNGTNKYTNKWESNSSRKKKSNKKKLNCTDLAILERLKACYNSNYNGGTPSNPIFVFQCPKICLARCLAHHNYFPALQLIDNRDSGEQQTKYLESVEQDNIN